MANKLAQLIRRNRRGKSPGRASLNQGLILTGLMGVGAGLMYFLDPARGKRRRAQAQDQLSHATSKVSAAVKATAHDLGHRVQGIIAKSERLFNQEPVPDEVLVARARAKLGRLVAQPQSIEVTAQQGQITLAGSVPAHEVERLRAGLAKVRGVQSVQERLEVQPAPGRLADSLGGKQSPQSSLQLLPGHSAPTSRLLITTSGGALVVYGLQRRDMTGAVLGTVGFGLLARELIIARPSSAEQPTEQPSQTLEPATQAPPAEATSKVPAPRI